MEAVLQQFRYFVSWNSEASLRFCVSQWSFIMVDAASKNPNFTRPNLWKSGRSTCPRKAGSQAKTRLPVFPFPHYIHWKIWQVFLWGCPKVETVRCCFHLIRAEQARRLLHTALHCLLAAFHFLISSSSSTHEIFTGFIILKNFLT